MKKTKRVISLVLALALLVAIGVSMSGCSLLGLTPGDTAGGTTEATGEGGLGGNYTTIIMLVLLVAVFYFFLIRPERKRKKKVEEMRSGLSVGDTITTIGGIVGKIVSIDGDLITLETGEDQVRMQFAKWGISTNSADTKK